MFKHILNHEKQNKTLICIFGKCPDFLLSFMKYLCSLLSIAATGLKMDAKNVFFFIG